MCSAVCCRNKSVKLANIFFTIFKFAVLNPKIGLKKSRVDCSVCRLNQIDQTVQDVFMKIIVFGRKEYYQEDFLYGV